MQTEVVAPASSKASSVTVPGVRIRVTPFDHPSLLWDFQLVTTAQQPSSSMVARYPSAW